MLLEFFRLFANVAEGKMDKRKGNEIWHTIMNISKKRFFHLLTLI